MSFPTYEEVLALKEDKNIRYIWTYLADKYNENPELLRSWFRRESDKRRKSEENALTDTDGDLHGEDESFDIKYKGEKSSTFDEQGEVKSISSKQLIEMSTEEEKDSKFVLRAHGFDPNEWLITSLINNYWQSPRAKDAGVRTLYQSKLSVKPVKPNTSITISDVEKFFSTFKPRQIINRYTPNGYDKNGMVLEVCLADIHVGNSEYSKFHMTIGERVDFVIEDILSRIGNIKISKILLVDLGDALHFDTFNRTTTSGTKITAGDMDNPTMFDEAISIFVSAIEKLKKIAPVEFIGIHGNHDKTSSYMLLKVIEALYKHDENVFIDVTQSHNSRKFKRFGENLVFWQHGEVNMKNLRSIVYREARKEFGETRFAEIHCGNIHHQQTVEADGMIIRFLPSLVSTDEWHHETGYTGAMMGSSAFLWDMNYGLRNIMFTTLPK